jgi:hypothetical protein
MKAQRRRDQWGSAIETAHNLAQRGERVNFEE